MLNIIKLEDRLLFDASLPSAIAMATGDAVAQSNEASAGTEANQTSESHESAIDTNDSTPAQAEFRSDEKSGTAVLVISSEVENGQALKEMAEAGVRTLIYDANSSLEKLYSQIQNTLEGTQADSIAFATHGQSGLFHLTQDTFVSADTLTHNAELASFWSKIGALLNEGGRVDLLGCNIAQNDYGLLESLEALTNAEVAASTDATQANNWTLEAGDIDAAFYFQANELHDWAGTLASFYVLNANDSGAGSLRQAIIDANATPGADVIDFSGLDVSSPQVINLASSLPLLTESVIIDATDAANYMFATQMVTLTNAPGDTLTVAADEVTIKGLNIINGNRDGIQVQSGFTNTVIESNVIGIDLNGDVASNADNGIRLSGSANTRIGSLIDPIEGRNIISGNLANGIRQDGGASDIVIVGNYIGVDSSGTLDRGNQEIGIWVGGATNPVIGGSRADGHGNLVSGNGRDGILVSSSVNAQVQGNIVGLNSTETAAIPNQRSGISISSDGAMVGGLDPQHGNVSSGNIGNGFNISGNGNRVLNNFAGTNFLTFIDPILGTTNDTIIAFGNGNIGISINRAGNFIGVDSDGNLAGNVASGNTSGIVISGSNAKENTVQANRIGVWLTGQPSDLGNQTGIRLQIRSNDNLIGGDNNLNQGNVIGGNIAGISVSGNSEREKIQGNYIGTNALNEILGNTDGISSSGPDTIIGGLTTGTNSAAGEVFYGNIISGNTEAGIKTGGNSHSISGNHIGVSKDGTFALPNQDGIVIGGQGAFVGGDIRTGAANVISGNLENGIRFTNNNAENNFIQGNIIGLTADGLSPLGNGDYGILQFKNNSTGEINTIGGDRTQGLGNIISGNQMGGIATTSVPGSNLGLVILGNIIGLDINGNLAIPNNGFGVQIISATGVIGGTGQGEGNIISGNAGNGIEISDTRVESVTILGNIIGLASDGVTERGNQGDGISILNARNVNVDIGDGTAAGRNVISANSGAGITADEGVVAINNNYIGTSSDGSAPKGNGQEGIILGEDLTPSTIEDNVISANGSSGLLVQNSENTIQGNYIGSSSSGFGDLGNAGDGILIDQASLNLIEDNTISSNSSAGIKVSGASAIGNKILNNSIFDNVAGGIVLLSGNNDLQTPEINEVIYDEAATTIDFSGIVYGPLGANMLLQFFANSTSNPTEGQAQTFLGQTSILSTGATNFSYTLIGDLPQNTTSNTIIATNQDTGDTSEISIPIQPTIIPAAEPENPDDPNQFSNQQSIRRIEMRSESLATIPFWSKRFSGFNGNGFISPYGMNQLTSFGSYLGYGSLLAQTNETLTIAFRADDSTLSNRNRDLGYSPEVQPVNYINRTYGMATKNAETQKAIESMSSAGSDVFLDSYKKPLAFTDELYQLITSWDF